MLKLPRVVAYLFDVFQDRLDGNELHLWGLIFAAVSQVTLIILNPLEFLDL